MANPGASYTKPSGGGVESIRLGNLRRKPLELLLIRHGEALYGPNDGLTELGVRQAELLAERLASVELAGIYSSTMARARQTAEAVAARTGHAITFDRRFREIDSGKRLEQSPEEHRRRAATFLRRTKVYTIGYEAQGGEGAAQLYERASTAISEVFSGPVKDNGGTYALIAHGGFINAALNYILDRRFDGTMRFRLQNTSISTVSLVEDSKLVIAVNDVAHLASIGGALL